jgi:hypothetical protein
MSVNTKTVEGDFASLHGRLARLQKRYGCTIGEIGRILCNRGDADLYPQLVSISADALKVVRRRHAYFAKHALYADGMFWYELFLTISAAPHRVRADKAEKYIPESVLNKLVVILIRIARYTTIEDLDITERNYEALGNTLLTFYSNDRVRFIRSQAESSPLPVKRLIRRAVRRVKEMRSAASVAHDKNTPMTFN